MDRNRSVYISLGDAGEATLDSSTILRTEILNALSNIDIEKEDIEGIENYSRNRWYVVFHRACTRSLAVGKTIELNEKKFKLQHPNPPRPRQNKFTTVRVYGYPLEADRETLKKALMFYGEVKSAHDMYDRICEIKTGARELCMELKHQIPSFIFAGKYQVKITYWGQKRTCRKCHQEGHTAKDCQAGSTCKECGATDHAKAECPKQRCYFCKEMGHIEAQCPKYYDDYPSMGENEETEQNGEKTTPDNGVKNNTEEPNAWGNGNRFSALPIEYEEPVTSTEENETEKTEVSMEINGGENTVNKEAKTVENDGAKTTNDQERKQKDTDNAGEIPENGNSPEKASSGVTPSDAQATTITEPPKENQTQENQTKESQTKKTEKPNDSKGQADAVFKKPTEQRETTKEKITSKSEGDEEETTDSEMEIGTNKKREREQAYGKSPGKKKKKRRQTYVSEAKQRNPFYADSN